MVSICLHSEVWTRPIRNLGKTPICLNVIVAGQYFSHLYKQFDKQINLATFFNGSIFAKAEDVPVLNLILEY